VQESSAKLGDPLVKLGSVADWKSRQKPRSIEVETETWLLSHPFSKVSDWACDGGGQLDHGSIAPKILAKQTAEVFESLTQWGPGFVVGGLTPQETCQLLAGMGPGFQNQVGQQGKGFPAELGRTAVCRGKNHGGGTEQTEDDIGHRSAACYERLQGYGEFTERQGFFTESSHCRPIFALEFENGESIHRSEPWPAQEISGLLWHPIRKSRSARLRAKTQML
jgi:hypothetical protein